MLGVGAVFGGVVVTAGKSELGMGIGIGMMVLDGLELGRGMGIGMLLSGLDGPGLERIRSRARSFMS